MLLKLTRWAYKAIGTAEDYLGMADWIVMYRVQTRQGIQLQANIGKLSSQCRLSSTETVIDIVECRQPQYTAGIYNRLQVAVVDSSGQPQQTAGSHSGLQVILVDYRQTQLNVGSHSRLQVTVIDCRQPQQITGRHIQLQLQKTQETQQFKQAQIMHLHDRAGTLASQL